MRRPDPIRSGFGYAKRGPEPADQFLFEVCENRTEDRGVLPETGERHAARASEGQTCFAKAEERQHSTDSGIEINSTMDTDATASFIVEALADRLLTEGRFASLFATNCP